MKNNINNESFYKEYDEYKKRLNSIKKHRRDGIGWLIFFWYIFMIGLCMTFVSIFLQNKDNGEVSGLLIGILIAGIVFIGLSVLIFIKYVHARRDARYLIKVAKEKNDEFVKKYGCDRVLAEIQRHEEHEAYLSRLKSSMAYSYFKTSSNSTSASSSSVSPHSASSSTSSSQRDYFYDGKGVLRKPGEYFYDGKGVLRKPGEYYYDSKGIMRKPGESFFDGKGDIRNPGESYNDSKRNLRDV